MYTLHICVYIYIMCYIYVYTFTCLNEKGQCARSLSLCIYGLQLLVIYTFICPLYICVYSLSSSKHEVRGIGSWNPFVVMFVESIFRIRGGQ